MGCCLSKNDPICSSSLHSNPNPCPQYKQVAQVEQKAKKIAAIEADQREEENQKREEIEKEEEKPIATTATAKKKEVFVIQHRKSNDKRPGAPDSDGSASNSSNSIDPIHEKGKRSDPNNGIGSTILAAAANGQAVRTSSCTKEEVDAILIQCGRLSRSSSGKGNGNERRYCGSKRSYDFERENEISGDVKIEINNCGDGEDDERQRRRQSRGSHHRRRSTPSRSRERVEKEQQQRSGSRERGERSSGRRISRSPQRRSESPMSHNGNSNGNNSGNGKPGKIVSVPATVSSLSMEKSNNGNGSGGDGGNVKRVLVKRNVGSPRSQSPARANQANGNGNEKGGQPQIQSLSRNGSRKAEQSPYRRTPLNEVDMNSLPFQPLANKRPPHKGKEIEEDGVVVVKQPLNSASQNKYSESTSAKAGGQGTHRRTGSRGAEGYEITKTNYCRVNELHTPNIEQEPVSPGGYDAMVTPVVLSGTETLELPQTLIRSRSSRRSRDLDINVDALLNPNPATNYNSLLLQDIQNFHQKNSSNSNSNSNGNASNSNNSTNTTPYTLPPCVTKACSILEAVADLNSSNGLADDRRINPRATAEIAPNRSNPNYSFHHSMKRVDGTDPFVESEVKISDDLMEPSIHKYVTVRKRGGDLDEVESSGSNSFVGGGHQNWVSSSSWEPNSADSTDCWTSKSYTREEGFSPVGFQRHAISDLVACGIDGEVAERKFSKNGMEKFEHKQLGTARAGRGSIQTS